MGYSRRFCTGIMNGELLGEGRCGGAIPSLIEERLQDQRSGDLVHNFFVLLASAAGFIEDLLRLVGRQALVPKMDGQAGQLAQLGGELLNLYSARADFSGEMNRVTHDDAGDDEAAGQSCDGTQVLAAVAPDLERHHRLCGEAQFVGDGNADALCADIEGEIARRGIH